MIEMRPAIFQNKMNAIRFKDCNDFDEQAYTGDATFLARAILDTIIQYSDAELRVEQLNSSIDSVLVENLLFNVYPVPASDKVYFYPQFVIEGNVEILIVDMLGKLILNENLNNDFGINTSNVSSGMYYYTLLLNGQNRQKGKIIIIKQ